MVSGPDASAKRWRFRRGHRAHVVEPTPHGHQPFLVLQHHPQPGHQSGARLSLQGPSKARLADPSAQRSNRFSADPSREFFSRRNSSFQPVEQRRLLSPGTDGCLSKRGQSCKLVTRQVRIKYFLWAIIKKAHSFLLFPTFNVAITPKIELVISDFSHI